MESEEIKKAMIENEIFKGESVKNERGHEGGLTFAKDLSLTKSLMCLSPDGGLKLLVDGKYHSVSVKPCFPWSEPTKYLSLRNENDEELMLVQDLADLDADSQAALKAVLKESEFCFVITDIFSIEEEYELRIWHVNTEAGERKFQTKLSDWPREVPGCDLMIQDVHKDVFFIPNPKALPAKAQKLLMPFID